MNENEVKTVATADARLDKMILQLTTDGPLRGFSRSQIQMMIDAGAVTVNGKVEKRPGAPIKAGQTIVITPPAPEPTHLTAYEFPLPIVFEDQSLIVLNKPPGISMHPGAGDTSRTILNALVAHLGASAELFQDAPRDRFGNTRPGIVHRLDKDTTGLVVIAKNVVTHHALTKQFSGRTVGRAYTALSLSSPRGSRVTDLGSEGEINAALGRDTKDRKKMAVTSDGKPATTGWKVIERLPYANLLELRLKTGRTHQIRVHLASVGAPVIGDLTYGDTSLLPPKLKQAAAIYGRQALHAHELAFDHPVSGERLSFSAPIPADLETLISTFRAGV